MFKLHCQVVKLRCQVIGGSCRMKGNHWDYFEELLTDPKFKIASAKCKHCKFLISITSSNLKTHLANCDQYTRSISTSLGQLAPFTKLQMVATNTNNLKTSSSTNFQSHEQFEQMIVKLIAQSMTQLGIITKKSSSIADGMNAKIFPRFNLD